jgi:hypothetical protein
MGHHTMTMSPIGRVFRAVQDQQFAMKTLVVATFSLLCAVCTEASADCPDKVAAAFELRTSGRPYRKDVTASEPSRELLYTARNHPLLRGDREMKFGPSQRRHDSGVVRCTSPSPRRGVTS